MRAGFQRWFALVALLAIAVPVLAACGGEDESDAETGITPEASTAEEGAPQAVEVDFAPEIGTIDNWYNGGATSLAELRGKPVLLVFWADY
jgi:hypothetical protein